MLLIYKELALIEKFDTIHLSFTIRSEHVPMVSLRSLVFSFKIQTISARLSVLNQMNVLSVDFTCYLSIPQVNFLENRRNFHIHVRISMVIKIAFILIFSISDDHALLYKPHSLKVQFKNYIFLITLCIYIYFYLMYMYIYLLSFLYF